MTLLDSNLSNSVSSEDPLPSKEKWKSYLWVSASPLLMAFLVLALSGFLFGKVDWKADFSQLSVYIWVKIWLLLTDVFAFFWLVVLSTALFPSLYPSFCVLIGWHYQIIRWALKRFLLFSACKRGADRAFCHFNNRAIATVFSHNKPNRIVLLLSRCLQTSVCKHDLRETLEACRRCGRCQIPDLLDMAQNHGIDICFNLQTEDSVGRVKEIKPDLAITLACEDRLVKGLLGTLSNKAYAVGTERSEEGCLSNSVDLDRVKRVLIYFTRM